MTSDLMTSSPSSSTAPDERPARSAGSLLLPIAGGALIAGSLLYVAGMATSPTADSMAPADYIASLARDPGQTALSALLLHYGNLALGLAWLAAPALVRGIRGRIPTVVGALMAALGLVTVAGFVLYDFWTGGIGRELDAGTAESLFTSVNAAPGLAVIGIITVLGLLGPLVGYVGLARAGVISWWLLVPPVATLVASAAMEFQPLPFAAFALVGAVTPIAVGLRLIRRNSAEAGAAA
jgi:hypothetical protein